MIIFTYPKKKVKGLYSLRQVVSYHWRWTVCENDRVYFDIKIIDKLCQLRAIHGYLC